MYPNNRYPRPAPIVKRRRTLRPFVIGAILLIVILGIGFGFMRFAQQAKDKDATPSKTNAPTFDKQQHSLTDPTSIWVVVNKQRPLSPKTYTPTDLRAPAIALRRSVTDPGMQLRDAAATALERLAAAAKKNEHSLLLASAYRSYDTQVSVYNSEVRAYGQATADQESARPGHSEHQTGLAADLSSADDRSCEIESCFADMSEGKWLAANAYKYGFIIRYPEGKTTVTGYKYEPWHVRYVGVELATEMHAKQIKTLEEFFGLPAAPNY